MAAKFYFFTDPSLLEEQSSTDSYGPAGQLNGKDHFRITDLHHSLSSEVPAFALCDARVCAQIDSQNTLSLILKPIQQPPFDFPFVSYVIYKGIDPSSLLAESSIRTDNTETNDLTKSIEDSWLANNSTNPPGQECLGFHLNPSSSDTDYPNLNLSIFDDSEPIDNLFYQGDSNYELPLVRGGWRIADFDPTQFGIEVIVECIGYRPKISLSRVRENHISVNTLPEFSYATNDSTFFMHWHEKEEILNFIDPAAFWGSFLLSKLRVWNNLSGKFDKLKGKEVYNNVLVGIEGNFFNRNRCYIDIRNEHGKSINYYKADGNDILLTLDPNADILADSENYYKNNWPLYWIESNEFTLDSSDEKAQVRFALPRTENTRPLIYISVGYAKTLQRLKDRDRFIDRPRQSDQPFIEEADLTIPLVDSSNSSKIMASYHKLYSFKRAISSNETLSSTVQPGNLNVPSELLSEQYFQIPNPEFLSAKSGFTEFKLIHQETLLNFDRYSTQSMVVMPAMIRDNNLITFTYVPVSSYNSNSQFRGQKHFPTPPSYKLLDKTDGTSELLYSTLKCELVKKEVQNPLESNSSQFIVETQYNFYQGVKTNLEPFLFLFLSVDSEALLTSYSSLDVALSPKILFLDSVQTFIKGGNKFRYAKLSVSKLTSTSTIQRVSTDLEVKVLSNDYSY